MKVALKNFKNPNLQLHNYEVTSKDGQKANIFALDADDAKLSLNKNLHENENNFSWVGEINLLNSEGVLQDTKRYKISAPTEEDAKKYLSQYIRVQQSDDIDGWDYAESGDIVKKEDIL